MIFTVVIRKTRERILKEAVKLFARKGFKSTTISDIAKKSSVNRAMIFYYFKNKEELYLTLKKKGFKELKRNLEENLPEVKDPYEKLNIWIKVFFEVMSKNKELLQILFREIFGSQEGKYMDDILNLLGSIISEGIKEGKFRKIDIKKSSISLLGMIIVFFQLEFFAGLSYPLKELTDHVFDIFYEGIRERRLV